MEINVKIVINQKKKKEKKENEKYEYKKCIYRCNNSKSCENICVKNEI